jgi:hypothetical protein
MRTRSETIAANIAARITRNKTRYKFSTLHRLALEETMSLQHPETEQQIADQKQAEHVTLLNRIAELEQRVAALEGKN